MILLKKKKIIDGGIRMISSTSLFDCSQKIYTITVWKAPTDHIATEFRNRIFHCREDNTLSTNLLIHNIYNDMGKLKGIGYDDIVEFIDNTFERKELISVASVFQLNNPSNDDNDLHFENI